MFLNFDIASNKLFHFFSKFIQEFEGLGRFKLFQTRPHLIKHLQDSSRFLNNFCSNFLDFLKLFKAC